MTEVVEGAPIEVQGRELVPLVRVTSRGHRRAHVGNERLDGMGWGFVHMRPIALLERDDADERRIPIQNETDRALTGLLVAAIIIPVVAIVSMLLARWIRSPASGSCRRRIAGSA